MWLERCVELFEMAATLVQYAIGLLTMTVLFAASYLFWNWYSTKEKLDYTFNVDDEGVSRGAVEGVDGAGLPDQKMDRDVLEKIFSKNETNNLAGATDVYNWNQNEKEVELYVPVESSIKGKEINCQIKSTSLMLTVRGEVLINGNFYASVVPDECNWQIGE
jgi:hypothetical protein